MAKIMTDSKHYTDIANAIREKTSSTEQMKPSEMSERILSIQSGGSYDEGYQDGMASYAERDAFIVGSTNMELASIGVSAIEGVLEIPAKIDEVYDKGYEDGTAEGGGGEDVLLYAKTLPSYYSSAFPEGYELTLTIPNFEPDTSGSFGKWGNVTGLKRLKLVSNATVSGLIATTLMNSSSIEEFDISEFPRNFTVMASTFLHCQKLRKILGELDLTSATFNGYEFYNCTSLEEIRIKAGTLNKSVAFAQSSKLSDASILSIIDGLADLSGQTRQTITFHKDMESRITPDQKIAIDEKNWSQVY